MKEENRLLESLEKNGLGWNSVVRSCRMTADGGKVNGRTCAFRTLKRVSSAVVTDKFMKIDMFEEPFACFVLEGEKWKEGER